MLTPTNNTLVTKWRKERMKFRKQRKVKRRIKTLLEEEMKEQNIEKRSRRKWRNGTH